MNLKLLRKIAFIKAFLALTARFGAPRAPANPKKGDSAYVKAYMNWFIRKQMKAHNIVGLSIALVDDQSIAWQQGFGYADRKYKIAATPRTLYRAGSISKLFNAMAVMQLVEDGKMDIDRPLSSYLPEFRIRSRFGDTRGITPRSIMTHHSGLPGNWIDGMWTEEPQTFTQLVHAIRDEYVAFPPDTVTSYSNLGVTLLGHAIQNVSGQAYAEFLDQGLLQPMGMKDSRYAAGISGNAAARSYRNGKEVVEYPLRDLPAGGLNTTVTDLARLAMLINNHGTLQDRRILSPGSVEAMLTAQNDDVPLDFDSKIGLAWGIGHHLLDDNEPVYHHGGGTIAHSSMFMVARKSRLGAVVLANSSNANTGDIAKMLLQMAWKAKNEVKPVCPRKPPVGKPSDFTGTFASMIGRVDIAKSTGDRYKVKSSVGNFDLDPGKDRRYRLKCRLLGILPLDLEEMGAIGFTTEVVAGHRVMVGELKGHRFLAGVQVEPHAIHAAWKSRVGHYTLLNPPEPEMYHVKDIELKMEGDYLVAAVTDSEDVSTLILRTVNADEAIMEGLGRDLGETIRVVEDSGANVILTYSGLRLRRLRPRR
jgi:CubicO group peptidase (beta-lactamase class C family)